MVSRSQPGSDAKSAAPHAEPTAAHTPGPWAWMGNQYGLYLATTHSGRRYVMGFRRMGTQGAQPVFQKNSRMVPAAELVEFEVGDGKARGFPAGKEDPSVYRYDVSGIDNADARLIAAAPDLLAALRMCVQRIERPNLSPDANVVLERAHAAISKAMTLRGVE